MAERPRTREAPAFLPREFISFRVGTQEFCVDAMAVKEVRAWSPATLLPRAPSYLRGVINLRGVIVPIVDLGERLNFPPHEPTEEHIVIVVWIERKLVGLLVDAVCDLVTTEVDAIETTSDLTGEDIHTLVKELITVEGRVIGLIALDQVMPSLEEQSA